MVDPFEYCRQIMEKHAKTFYLASQRLPENDRKHFWSIYAYCRTVDDIADEHFISSPQKGLEELEKIYENLNLSFNKNYSGENAIFLALNDTFSKFTFKIEPFIELIEGAKWDLERRPIENIDDLIEYSRLVAGSVGAMLLPIMSKEPEKLYEKAYNYGIFMQIVNIIRDVGEDLKERNRIYLPLSLLRKFQINIEDLKKGLITPNYKLLIENLMELAENIFNNSKNAIKLLKKEVRTAIHLAGIWYLEILNAIRLSRYDNLSKRNYVSKFFKLLSTFGMYNLRKKILILLDKILP